MDIQNLSLFSMATSDETKMPCEPDAREQRVTTNSKDSKRKSRSRHKKAADGSSSAPASNVGQERGSPTVDASSETTSVGASKENSADDDGGSQPPAGPISYHKLLAEHNRVTSKGGSGYETLGPQNPGESWLSSQLP